MIYTIEILCVSFHKARLGFEERRQIWKKAGSVWFRFFAMVPDTYGEAFGSSLSFGLDVSMSKL